MNKSDENITTLWNSTFDVGVQILPDYSEDGNNKGFSKSRPIATINFDTRWTKDKNGTGSVKNIGIDIKFLGTAADSNRTSPSSFNDVSDTLDISIYGQYIPDFDWMKLGMSRDLFSEIGVITHIGLRSRDQKSSVGDTVDTYADIGLKYSYFNTNPYKTDGIANELPNFYMGAYGRYYSDYNGFSDHIRYVIDFKYKVSPKYNFFIGAEANIGQHEDEMYLTLTFRNDINKLFSFFGVGEE
ncbi:hypothetical protein KKB80_05925 [bacterium]|nr:hypothetical protein [bacterium]